MELERYTMDLNAKCMCGCMDGDRIHNIYRFPNDYGASVASTPRADPVAKGTFRLHVLHYDSPSPEHDNEIVRETPLTDDHSYAGTGRMPNGGWRRYMRCRSAERPATTATEFFCGLSYYI
jgi:hypothetical protein